MWQTDLANLASISQAEAICGFKVLVLSELYVANFTGLWPSSAEEVISHGDHDCGIHFTPWDTSEELRKWCRLDYETPRTLNYLKSILSRNAQRLVTWSQQKFYSLRFCCIRRFANPVLEYGDDFCQDLKTRIWMLPVWSMGKYDRVALIVSRESKMDWNSYCRGKFYDDVRGLLENEKLSHPKASDGNAKQVHLLWSWEWLSYFCRIFGEEFNF